jgi:hypothetical protein
MKASMADGEGKYILAKRESSTFGGWGTVRVV